MKIFLYNTLGRKKQEFVPIKKGKVGIYYCGPTVYWTQHIGNLRGSFCVDIVHRSFLYFGYNVQLVRNYTDVGHLSSDEDEGEDKMTKGAKREGLNPDEIAAKYIKIYEQDTAELNIISPSNKPKATENIDEMIKMVSGLLEKGYAYSTDRAIYFDVSKSPDYHKLSGQKTEKNISGAGTGEVSDKNKKNKEDFVLWFFRCGPHKNALQYWSSPFNSPLVENGLGFPGWHIECSAMSKRFLGDTFDIHMGGIEHVPVHHTNEIAQSEAANQKPFANYWLHNEHLLVDEGKMAKSEGTSYSLSEIKANGYKALDLRYFYLQANYRSKQNFTWEALDSAARGFSRLQGNILKLGNKVGTVDKAYRDKFESYLADDFNAPRAFSVLQEMLKSDLSDADKLATVHDFDRVLGLGLKNIKKEEAPEEVKKLLLKRDRARQEKDWEESDRLRTEIEKLGYTIEDGASGSVVKKI